MQTRRICYRMAKGASGFPLRISAKCGGSGQSAPVPPAPSVFWWKKNGQGGA